ncbi:MAG: glycine cleavage system protein R [Proteobacteria bacterium]|nr:glycine cleavage system protein R [Pseudomonadota bacterium]
MESSYIITFIGDDRPGLVEQLSTVIEENRGNWLESQLSQLGGKFAGLVLVSIPDGGAAQLESALKALSVSGLSVRVTPTGSGQTIRSARKITLTIIGPDRLGIVREISQALASHQVNVVEMDSQVTSAPMSAEMLFQARIDAEIPLDTQLDDLSDMLDEIANHMTLDISLEST